tara:strand:- start:58 stop:438 length:381 start_codon:yes stop_codon:yes gene_type:complete
MSGEAVIRKDFAICVEALEIALNDSVDRISREQGFALVDKTRAWELLSRLKRHVAFMCENCEGLGRDLNLKQPCTYCAGSGIEPTADPRLSFCAPEQVIGQDDVEGVGVGFIAHDEFVVTGREIEH